MPKFFMPYPMKACWNPQRMSWRTPAASMSLAYTVVPKSMCTQCTCFSTHTWIAWTLVFPETRPLVFQAVNYDPWYNLELRKLTSELQNWRLRRIQRYQTNWIWRASIWALLDRPIQGLRPVARKMHHVQWLGTRWYSPCTRKGADDTQPDAWSTQICRFPQLLDCTGKSDLGYLSLSY